jgi:hypothetical protein
MMMLVQSLACGGKEHKRNACASETTPALMPTAAVLSSLVSAFLQSTLNIR